MKKFKKWNYQMHLNKMAFDFVIDGYKMLKYKSTIISLTDKVKEGKEAINRGAPTEVDFKCDVDNVIYDTIKDHKLRRKFVVAYIETDDPYVHFGQSEASYLEQQVGKEFRKRSIYPIKLYFKSVRKKYDAIRGSN